MIFDKAAQQWICTNPLELVTGMRMAFILSEKKEYSIIAGTVLCVRNNDLFMFQTNEPLRIAYITDDTSIDFEKGSCIRFRSSSRRWEVCDMDFLPPFGECRFPSLSELKSYNKLCKL